MSTPYSTEPNPIKDDLDFQSEAEALKGFYLSADKGLRFINFIVDRILALGVLMLIGSLGEFIQMLFYDVDLYAISAFIDLISLFFWFSHYPLYCIFFEHFNKGKTIGKLLTKTKVVTENGKQPSFWTIVGRSYARLIPFNHFVVLFNNNGKGLHDMVSNTKVVLDRK